MVGTLSVILYAIITAISILTIHHVTQSADPNVVMIYTFLVCILFFNLINFKKTKPTYDVAKNNFYLIFMLNFASAIIWLATFWSLKYLTPALFITIFMGVTPITSAIIGMIQKKKFDKIAFISSLIIVVIIILLAIFHQRLVPVKQYYIQGIAFTVLGGIAASIYMEYSKALQQIAKFTPIQMLSTRFYLTTIVGILLTLYHPSLEKFYQNIQLEYILLIAAVSMILPLYFFQVGIHRLGPLKTSYLISLTPVFTYFVELFYGIPFSFIILSLILLLCVTLGVSVKLKAK